MYKLYLFRSEVQELFSGHFGSGGSSVSGQRDGEDARQENAFGDPRASDGSDRAPEVCSLAQIEDVGAQQAAHAAGDVAAADPIFSDAYVTSPNSTSATTTAKAARNRSMKSGVTGK